MHNTLSLWSTTRRNSGLWRFLIWRVASSLILTQQTCSECSLCSPWWRPWSLLWSASFSHRVNVWQLRWSCLLYIWSFHLLEIVLCFVSFSTQIRLRSLSSRLVLQELKLEVGWFALILPWSRFHDQILHLLIPWRCSKVCSCRTRRIQILLRWWRK